MSSPFRYVVWRNDRRTKDTQPAVTGHVQLPLNVIREIGRAMQNGELTEHIEKDKRHENAEYIKLDVSLWKVAQTSEKSPLLSGEIKTWGEMKAKYAAADAKKSGVSTDDDFSDLPF